MKSSQSFNGHSRKELICDTNMTKTQKRWAVERLIKLAGNPGDVWNVVEYADKIDYSLTGNQKKSIVSKLVSFPDVDFEKVESYVNCNGLRLHYVMETTQQELKKIFGF